MAENTGPKFVGIALVLLQIDPTKRKKKYVSDVPTKSLINVSKRIYMSSFN